MFAKIQEMEEKKKICAVCQTPTKKQCSACLGIYYCSKEHQISDWKIHARYCQPCKLDVHPKIGRHYIATKNIRIGETVLRDTLPLTTGVLSHKPACLRCYVDLTAQNAIPCRTCGWPLCNECTEHGMECAFTMKYRRRRVTIANYEMSHDIYETIAVIRALALRENNPPAYRKILQLEDYGDKVGQKLNILEWSNEVACLVKSFYNYDEVEVAEIARIHTIIQMNAVMVKYNKPHHIALYDKTSKVEHNCRANCSRSYTVQGGILLWAAVPISKGEHISISYMHCSFSTMKRRDHLAGTKFLECDCDRCKDPTEFGTMFSVFTCMENDCTGFMIPPTFLAPSDNLPNFVCNKCSISVPWVVIEEMEERLDEKIDELENDVHAMKQFVESQSKIVHKNHFAHFNSDLELIRSIDPNSLARFSEESLHDVIQRCQRLDNILETLDPAEHGQRARVCYMLVRAKAVIHERGKFCFNDVCAYVNDMDLALTKVYQLTRFEPPLCETEFEIAIAALAQLKKMEKTKPIYTN